MFEQSYFSVDSDGEAERHEATKARRRGVAAFVVGQNRELIIPIGPAPLTIEQIAGHRYFADPGGRIIDTQTGEVLTHGDGTYRVALGEVSKLVQDHQQPDKEA